MRRELQQIPPAPRVPRWPPVLWARWPLAFVAFVGAIYGGVITMMLAYAWRGQPSEDRWLDEGAQRAIAHVTSVELIATGSSRKPVARVSYRFALPTGEAMDGLVYAPADEFAAGTAIDVEYLPHRPHTNRIRGHRLSQLRNLALPMWRWCVLPGFFALLLWLWSVQRTRRLLSGGDVTIAELLEVKPVPWVLPGMLRVHYRFRDHRARERRGTHWVRARSALGHKLTATPAPPCAPAVHDRTRPWRSRVVTVDDFVLAPLAPHPHAADAPTPWTHDL